MDKLERKIPPVALFVLFFVVINHISHEFLTFKIGLPLNSIIFGVCFLAAGIAGLGGCLLYKFEAGDE